MIQTGTQRVVAFNMSGPWSTRGVILVCRDTPAGHRWVVARYELGRAEWNCGRYFEEDEVAAREHFAEITKFSN
jgi:hypothetical protein